MDRCRDEQQGLIDLIDQLQQDLQREQEKNRQIINSIRMFSDKCITEDELIRRIDLIDELTSSVCNRSCRNCSGGSSKMVANTEQPPIIQIVTPFTKEKKLKDMTERERRIHNCERNDRWFSSLTPEQQEELRLRKLQNSKNFRLRKKARIEAKRLALKKDMEASQSQSEAVNK